MSNSSQFHPTTDSAGYDPGYLNWIERNLPATANRVLLLGTSATALANIGRQLRGRECTAVCPPAGNVFTSWGIKHVAWPGDGTEPDVPEHAWDVAICAASWDALTNPLQLLKWIRRRLAQDGSLLGRVVNGQHVGYLLDWIVGRERAGSAPFTRASLRRALDEAGFVPRDLLGRQATQSDQPWRLEAEEIVADGLRIRPQSAEHRHDLLCEEFLFYAVVRREVVANEPLGSAPARLPPETPGTDPWGWDYGSRPRRRRRAAGSPVKDTNHQTVIAAPSHPLPSADKKIALCMIARDSSRTLPAALASIRPWVDEMIVVDTGSIDDTRRIAEDFGARVFHFPWCDDFSAARNESLKHAQAEWLLWMDSDDTIDEANGRKLRDLVPGTIDPRTLAFVLQVHCPASHGNSAETPTIVDHVKLLRNLPGMRFEFRIHEQILPAIHRLKGQVAWTDIFLAHSGSDHSPAGWARKLGRDLRLLQLECQDRPKHPFVLFNLGMTYLEAGEADRAEAALRHCLRVSGTQESHVRKAYALLAAALQEEERLAEAADTCRQGLEVCPGDPELLFRLGVLALLTNDLDTAETSLERLRQGTNDRHFTSIDAGILGHKLHFNMGRVYLAQGRHDAAVVELRKSVDLEPRFRPAWQALVETALAQQKVPLRDEIERDLRKQNLFPAETAMTAVRRLSAQNKLREAAEAAYPLIRDFPDDESALRLACDVLFQHGPLERAAAALEQLALLAPEDPSAHHNLGTIYFRRGNMEEAVRHYELSLRGRPDFAQTHYYVGEAWRRLGHHDAAKKAWRDALRIEPAHADAQRALAALDANLVG